jgi:hypothetical protein
MNSLKLLIWILPINSDPYTETICFGSELYFCVKQGCEGIPALLKNHFLFLMKHDVSVTSTNSLILLMDIIPVYSKNKKTHQNPLWAKRRFSKC